MESSLQYNVSLKRPAAELANPVKKQKIDPANSRPQLKDDEIVNFVTMNIFPDYSVLSKVKRNDLSKLIFIEHERYSLSVDLLEFAITFEYAEQTDINILDLPFYKPKISLMDERGNKFKYNEIETTNKNNKLEIITKYTKFLFENESEANKFMGRLVVNKDLYGKKGSKGKDSIADLNVSEYNHLFEKVKRTVRLKLYSSSGKKHVFYQPVYLVKQENFHAGKPLAKIYNKVESKKNFLLATDKLKLSASLDSLNAELAVSKEKGTLKKRGTSNYRESKENEIPVNTKRTGITIERRPSHKTAEQKETSKQKRAVPENPNFNLHNFNLGSQYQNYHNFQANYIAPSNLQLSYQGAAINSFGSAMITPVIPPISPFIPYNQQLINQFNTRVNQTSFINIPPPEIIPSAPINWISPQFLSQDSLTMQLQDPYPCLESPYINNDQFESNLQIQSQSFKVEPQKSFSQEPKSFFDPDFTIQDYEMYSYLG